MHPVNFLFHEIYRKHWGIPAKREPSRTRHEQPAWRHLKSIVRSEPRS